VEALLEASCFGRPLPRRSFAQHPGAKLISLELGETSPGAGLMCDPVGRASSQELFFFTISPGGFFDNTHPHFPPRKSFCRSSRGFVRRGGFHEFVLHLPSEKSHENEQTFLVT